MNYYIHKELSLLLILLLFCTMHGSGQTKNVLEEIQKIKIDIQNKDSVFRMIDSISTYYLEADDPNSYAQAQLIKGYYFLRSNLQTEQVLTIEKHLDQLDTLQLEPAVAYDLFFFKGQYHFYSGDKGHSLKYFQSAYRLASELGDRDKEVTAGLQLGVNSNFLDKYAEAHHYINEAYEYFEDKKDTAFMIYCLSHLGNVYKRIEAADLAKEVYFKSILLDKNYEGYSTLSATYSNLALVYADVLQDYDSAIYFHKKGISELNPENDEKINNFKTNIGILYSQKGNYDSAEYYLDQVLKKKEWLSSDNYLMAGILSSKGEVLVEQAKYDEALKMLREAVEISYTNNYYTFLINSLTNLIKIDTIYKDYQKAFFRNMERSEAMKKKAFNDEKALVLKQNFETQLLKSENQKERLQNENKLQNGLIIKQNILIFIVFILLAGTLLFSIIQYRNHQKIQKLNHELRFNNQLLERQKDQLDQSNLTKTKLLSVLGHDLKTPFNTLIGLLDLLYEDWNEHSDQEKKEFIKNIHESSQRAFQLLMDVLQFTKTQLDIKKQELQDVNLNDLVHEVVEFIEKEAQAKELEINILVDKDLQFKSQPFLIKQVLQNFLTNAVKFTLRGGQIEISAGSISNGTYLCVKDSGIGLSENHLKDIFTPQFNYSRKGTENEKSSGLGLMLVTEYAKLLNAHLDVSSEPNNGSRFCLIME